MGAVGPGCWSVLILDQLAGYLSISFMIICFTVQIHFRYLSAYMLYFTYFNFC